MAEKKAEEEGDKAVTPEIVTEESSEAIKPQLLLSMPPVLVGHPQIHKRLQILIRHFSTHRYNRMVIGDETTAATVEEPKTVIPEQTA